MIRTEALPMTPSRFIVNFILTLLVCTPERKARLVDMEEEEGWYTLS